jgi:hypothetical protein
MEAGAVIAIVVSLMIVIVPLATQWTESQAKARERRMAEHRMNARLLRLDI